MDTNTVLQALYGLPIPVIQVVEIQVTLQDGHHLVNHNKIHEKLQP